jgi:hypothetical protein
VVPPVVPPDALVPPELVPPLALVPPLPPFPASDPPFPPVPPLLLPPLSSSEPHATTNVRTANTLQIFELIGTSPSSKLDRFFA